MAPIAIAYKRVAESFWATDFQDCEPYFTDNDLPKTDLVLHTFKVGPAGSRSCRF